MKLKSSTPKDLMSEIKNMDIKMVDMRFTDIPGTTQHFTIPIKFLDEDRFSDGLGFDGSSVNNINLFIILDEVFINCSSSHVVPPLTTSEIW